MGAQALLRLCSVMLTLGLGKSGSCSHPATKTEPAKKRSSETMAVMPSQGSSQPSNGLSEPEDLPGGGVLALFSSGVIPSAFIWINVERNTSES